MFRRQHGGGSHQPPTLPLTGSDRNRSSYPKPNLVSPIKLTKQGRGGWEKKKQSEEIAPAIDSLSRERSKRSDDADASPHPIHIRMWVLSYSLYYTTESYKNHLSDSTGQFQAYYR